MKLTFRYLKAVVGDIKIDLSQSSIEHLFLMNASCLITEPLPLLKSFVYDIHDGAPDNSLYEMLPLTPNLESYSVMKSIGKKRTSLEINKFTDLKSLKKLELNISDNLDSDDILQLVKMSSLTHLDIGNNEINKKNSKRDLFTSKFESVLL